MNQSTGHRQPPASRLKRCLLESTVPRVTVEQPSWLVTATYVHGVESDTLSYFARMSAYLCSLCTVSKHMAKQTLMQTAETLYVSSLLRPNPSFWPQQAAFLHICLLHTLLFPHC